jgi:pyrroloquinoline quinone (PQQ) biosynthesis protein C
MTVSEQSLATLEQMLSQSGLREHPFLLSWSAGELSNEELRAFASQQYHILDSLPRCVSAVHAGTADIAVRRELVKLLTILEAPESGPAELWLRTCAALGLFSDSVRNAPPTVPTAEAIGVLRSLAETDAVEGLAALVAAFRVLPSACQLQRDGLVAHYGLQGGPGLAFFEVFGYQASAHANTLGQLLRSVVADDSDAARAAHDAALAATAALRDMLSSREA